MHDAGDPYRAECERTVELLSRRLDLPEGLAQLTSSPSSDPPPGSDRPPSTRSASSSAPVALPRRHLPRLRLRLPGDSRGDQPSSTARPSPLPEAAASTTSPGATTRRRHCHPGSAGQKGTGRLDLSPARPGGPGTASGRKIGLSTRDHSPSPGKLMPGTVW